jgi:chromosome partitioning protein
LSPCSTIALGRLTCDLPIIKISENLDVVPSILDLASIELELASKFAREVILKKLMDKVKDSYEYVLIDLPPSLGLITLKAHSY